MAIQVFGDEDLPGMNTALDNAADVHEVLDRAEQAGINVDDFRRRLQESEAVIRGLKSSFFPGR